MIVLYPVTVLSVKAGRRRIPPTAGQNHPAVGGYFCRFYSYRDFVLSSVFSFSSDRIRSLIDAYPRAAANLKNCSCSSGVTRTRIIMLLTDSSVLGLLYILCTSCAKNECDAPVSMQFHTESRYFSILEFVPAYVFSCACLPRSAVAR